MDVCVYGIYGATERLSLRYTTLKTCLPAELRSRLDTIFPSVKVIQIAFDESRDHILACSQSGEIVRVKHLSENV